MHKLFALYINELVKMRKKISVIILLSLIVLSGLALPGITRAFEIVSEMPLSGISGSFDDDAWMKDSAKSSLLNFESFIKKADLEIDKIRESKDYSDEVKQRMIQSQEEQKAQYQDSLDVYTIAFDHEIYPDFQTNYLSETVFKVIEMKGMIRSVEAYLAESPNEELEKQLPVARELVANYLTLLEKPDFPTYVTLESERIELDPYMSADEKEVQKEILDVRATLQPEGDLVSNSETYHMQSVLTQITNIKNSVNSGIDYTTMGMNSTPMNPEEKVTMAEREMIIDYRLQNDIFPTKVSHQNRMNAIYSAYSAGLFLIMILVVILAGSSISQEIATGSIKSLIIAPVRRWKIFTAKLLSLISIAFLSMLVLYVAGLLGQGIFYGFTENLPYLYVANGEIASLPFAVYMFLYLLSSFIEVIVYLLFAFLLSVITRNTAISVALPLGSMFLGISIIKPMISFIPNMEILKFIPFMHFDLVTRIFQYSNLMTGEVVYDFSILTGGARYTPPGVSFSLIYIGVLCLCMLYTAFDSFTRRDIR